MEEEEQEDSGSGIRCVEDLLLCQYVKLYPNGLAVVGLKENHPIIVNGPRNPVVGVSWDVGRQDRSKVEVKGKKKAGSLDLQSNSPLCLIRCQDGTQHKIVSQVGGRLIEINEHLSEHPSLLLRKPLSNGYIAIIYPGKNELNRLNSKLLDQTSQTPTQPSPLPPDSPIEQPHKKQKLDK